MGRYTVELTEEFDIHLNHWMKVGNKAILRKIEKILPVSEDPDFANKLKSKKTISKDFDLKKDGIQSI